MNSLLVIFYLLASNCMLLYANHISKTYYEDDTCDHQVSGLPGICRRVSKCPSALIGIRQRKRPQHCSFIGDEQIVCCQIESQQRINSEAENEVDDQNYAVERSKRMCERYGNVLQPETTDAVMTSSPPVTRMTKESKPSVLIFRFGAENDVDPRIYGGVNATYREFPHMAAIGYGEENDITWACGGSLISDQYVLTAAHCLQSQTSLARWVRIGSLNLETSGNSKPQQFAVIERLPHPDYQRQVFYNDIALLKLNTTAIFNDDVRPACLQADDVEAGKPCIATGWGAFSDSLISSKDLLKVELLVQNPSVCNATYQPITRNSRKLSAGFTTDSMICAGELNGNKDTCSGDSGGPIQLKLSFPPGMYSIIGVTSFGMSPCGGNTSPAVYTRVSFFLPWIVQTIWPKNSTD